MSTERSYKNLLLVKQDRVAVVSINRPSALNALNLETLSELKQLLHDLSRDAHVSAVVLTGTGEKAFIAGADISEMRSMSPQQAVAFSQLGHEVAASLSRMPKPTIAAVNGFALGGGTEMAIACDWVIASESAQFGLPEVSLGVIPGFGGTFRLARLVGVQRAKELIFTGRRIQSEEALRIGLCVAVCPAKDLMAVAIESAAKTSKNSLAAISKAKALINELASNETLGLPADAESHSFGRLFGEPDQIEGMAAFQEKRKPIFKGAHP